MFCWVNVEPKITVLAPAVKVTPLGTIKLPYNVKLTFEKVPLNPVKLRLLMYEDVANVKISEPAVILKVSALVSFPNEEPALTVLVPTEPD